jgi:hypothetical protein
MADTALAQGKPQTLDDLMIAMDVVDTLRHREDLVRRELNEEGREEDLIARLRKIYRDQGIEVPDQILADGVKALKDSRFVYTPPPAGWKRSLLTFWAKRDTHGKRAAYVLAAIIALFASYHLLITRPAQLAAEQERVEITETLPKSLRQAHADVLTVGNDPAAKQKADALLADGERAIRDGDRAAMTRITGELTALRNELAAEYTLVIVSRPGESSGVWRRPPRGNQARNYYLIVEPIAPDGRKLSLPVRNEETGASETVSKFGVRVPQQTFETVASDKRDDGIVQRNQFGIKKRGTLAVDYKMPFEGGIITQW